MRDFRSVAAALREADIVVNAAAMKQVPTCEYFPYEAVRTNIEGAENIVRAIQEHRLPVEMVVGVSTDKACKPVNTMGMTKAIQERIFIQANMRCPQTRFVCVRYGNVLASRGSVIPLFHEQITQRRTRDHHDPGDDAVPTEPGRRGGHDLRGGLRRTCRRDLGARSSVRAASSISPAHWSGDRANRDQGRSASGPARRSTRSWSARRKPSGRWRGAAGTRSGRCCPRCVKGDDEPRCLTGEYSSAAAVMSPSETRQLLEDRYLMLRDVVGERGEVLR